MSQNLSVISLHMQARTHHMSSVERFSGNLRVIKEYNHLSVASMARAMALAPATVKRALNGRPSRTGRTYNPTLRTVTQVAVCSGMTVKSLLGETLLTAETPAKHKAGKRR